MNENSLPTNNLNPQIETPKEVPDEGARVFDISGDTISLVKEEQTEPVLKPIDLGVAGFVTEAVAKRTPVVDTRTIPPNPVPKTVGFGQMGGFGQAPEQAKPNLQDALSNVVPTNQDQKQNTTPFHDDPSEHLLRRLRTYEGDVAEAMSHKKVSASSIAIAETKRQTGQETISNKTKPVDSSRSGRKLFMVLLSIILIGGGVIGAYYLYSISPLAPVANTTPNQQIRSSIIPSDSRSAITLSSRDIPAILKQIDTEVQKSQPAGTIKEIIFFPQNTTTTQDQLGTKEMLELMDITAPDILTRSLTEEWMFGVYADSTGEKSVFIVTTTNFFQNAFAGMLQWENLMIDELRVYLDLNTLGVTTLSPTPTSNIATTPNTSYSGIRGRFEDKIIKNKDLRAFRTDRGDTLLIYSFIDTKHIVITDKEGTLAELIQRLEKQSFVR